MRATNTQFIMFGGEQTLACLFYGILHVYQFQSQFWTNNHFCMYLNLKLIYFIVWQNMRLTHWEGKQCCVMGGIGGGKLQTKWTFEKGTDRKVASSIIVKTRHFDHFRGFMNFRNYRSYLCVGNYNSSNNQSSRVDHPKIFAKLPYFSDKNQFACVNWHLCATMLF